MKPTNNLQVNSRVYWNHIYTTPAKEVEYWTDTARFPTALTYVKDGDSFLDLGCGVGVLCRMVAKQRKDCKIWGVDISDEVIEKNRSELPDVRWKQGYIGSLEFLPETYFDVVFCGETIEHLDDPAVLFADAYRALKPGGKLIITTPIEDHIDSPEHVWEFEKADIEKLYKDAGFGSVEFVDLPDTEYLVVFFAVGTK